MRFFPAEFYLAPDLPLSLKQSSSTHKVRTPSSSLELTNSHMKGLVRCQNHCQIPGVGPTTPKSPVNVSRSCTTLTVEYRASFRYASSSVKTNHESANIGQTTTDMEATWLLLASSGRPEDVILRFAWKSELEHVNDPAATAFRWYLRAYFFW